MRKMKLMESDTTTIPSEEAATKFLAQNNLLSQSADADPCHKCGTTMKTSALTSLVSRRNES